ncbi:MAG: hypothetical protein PWQ80_1444 [Thermotoga sp.]|nr:hypothetical protein [Thermotoga sp.]
MKKFLVVMMVLVVAMGLFAAGRGFGGYPMGPGFDRHPMVYGEEHCFGYGAPEYPMRAERGFNYGLGLRIRDEEQLKLAFKTRVAEALDQLNLSDDQLKELYNVVKEAKEKIDSLEEKLAQLREEYYNALVKRDTETAKGLQDQMWDLKDEISDTYRDFVRKVDDIITVDQYRRFRGLERMLFVLLTDEGFEVLQDMVQE